MECVRERSRVVNGNTELGRARVYHRRGWRSVDVEGARSLKRGDPGGTEVTRTGGRRDLKICDAVVDEGEVHAVW